MTFWIWLSVDTISLLVIVFSLGWEGRVGQFLMMPSMLSGDHFTRAAAAFAFADDTAYSASMRRILSASDLTEIKSLTDRALYRLRVGSASETHFNQMQKSS